MLHQSGYALYALTNFSAEKFPAARAQYPFFGMFRDVVVSGVVQLAKPDPRIFQLTLTRIGRPATECIYIDDFAPNVAVAAQLGFRAIQFFSADQLTADLFRVGIRLPSLARQ
jgi:2-haloacid dehalogenase